jgi:hypothetical protein
MGLPGRLWANGSQNLAGARKLSIDGGWETDPMIQFKHLLPTLRSSEATAEQRKRVRHRKSLGFECLEPRLPLSNSPGQLESELILTELTATTPSYVAAPTSAGEAQEGVNSNVSHWASTRGVYTFSLNAAQGNWAPKEWTLAQWNSWLDTLQFLNLNHLQLLRAPWSERPGLTPGELDKENLWISVLQSAKARGMTTSLIFGTTWHGDLAYPWKILSPGNSPADPNWQTLVNDYNYWANRYGPWVDEWIMGVEDPGGSPSSAGISWPYETPSPLGNPSRVSELVALELAKRTAVQRVNPNARIVAETWGLQWWGLTPGFSSHLNEFLSYVPALPADITLSTNALDDSITNTLQATGRDVNAWPFFLIDHEFPVGHTKLHFNWTRDYLRKIKNQGIDDVVAHISHPMEQLPSLYIYSRLLENTELNKLTLLQEFAAFLVSDTSDQTALASAISNLGRFYESVSGIANWDPAKLQPVNSTAPYAPRYNATQLGYLNTALSNINAVDSPRAVSQIPMTISTSQWVQMLRDQITFLHNAAYIGALVTQSANYANNNFATVNALTEPITRATAQTIVDDFLAAGSAGAIEAMEDYLAQFWPTTTGQNHPLGIIYDFVRTNVPAMSAAGVATIGGDFLEYDAPAHPALFKHIVGRTEETDSSFSYLRSDQWVTNSTPGVYSGDSAMLTSVNNNEVNIVFAGSGVALVHSLWSQGATATWTIDGGAGGSGTINMKSAIRQDQIETQLASGLAQTLHVLTIKKTGGAATDSIMVDAVRVNNNYRLRREDNREMFAYSGPWAELTLGTPSGGAWQYTIDATANVNIPFNGTAISIAATTRADYGTLAWSIDNGAGGSGTVSLANANNTYRKPFILTTTLSPGPHTLRLSKQSGFLINIDAIDTLVTPPLAGDYDRNGSVQQADYSVWQANFGATAGPGLAADGNGNGVVDAADYAVWRDNLPTSAVASAQVAAAFTAASPVAPTIALVGTEGVVGVDRVERQSRSLFVRDGRVEKDLLIAARDEAFSRLDDVAPPKREVARTDRTHRFGQSRSRSCEGVVSSVGGAFLVCSPGSNGFFR